MSRYVAKKNLVHLIQEREGIQETLPPEVVIETLGSDETEKIDPRYIGLEEVYFQDTEGRLDLILQAHQIRSMGEFVPIGIRKSPNSVSVVTYSMSNLSRDYKPLIANVFNGVHKDNPHRSESHPGHHYEKK